MNKHTSEILRGASSALIIKVFSAGVTFLFYLYLGRVLGAEKTGIFFLGLSILTIASVVGRFGLENTLLKIVAKESSQNNWGLIISAHKKSTRYVFFLSSFVFLSVFFLSSKLSVLLFSSPDMAQYVKVVALSIVPLSLSVLNAQAIQGLKKITGSTVVLNLFIPLFALFGAAAYVSEHDVLSVAIVYTVAVIVTYFMSLYLWLKSLPVSIQDIYEYKTEKILESCIPLFWVSVMQMVVNWLSFIVLGVYATDADVGVLGVATRIVTLMGFFLMAVNSITAPKIAEMYKSNDHHALENMCRSASTILLYATLPFGIIIFIFSDSIMGLFGDDFLGNAIVLQILLFGQFVNIVTGSVGVLLIMSGNEKIMRNNLFLTMLFCAFLNIVLIPEYGLIGAAVSFSLSMAAQNLISLYKVKKIMCISTLPFINPIKVIRGG